MRLRTLTLAGAFLLLCSCPLMHGQETAHTPSSQATTSPKDSDDTIAILGVGASTNWNFNGGAATFAPNFAAECTPIENWLELEAGVSPFYTRNSTEWDTDFLFKKPWDLSGKAEFMAASARNGRTSGNMGRPAIPSQQNSRRRHVLAERQAPLRLVSGPRLRLQLCRFRGFSVGCRCLQPPSAPPLSA